MGKGTNIEWCDSTVSPSTGCQGCELWKPGVGGPCYAGNYHETRMAKALPLLYAPNFDEVRLVPGRMAKAAVWSDLLGKPRPEKPWLDGMPRLIFVSDMGDLFSKAVPFDYIKSEVIDVATSPKGSRHIWMLLTKQARRMAKFAEWLTGQGVRWPRNVWAGTSITTQATASRAEHLKRVPAKVRYLSLEPQLEFVDLTRALGVCWRCRGIKDVDNGNCSNCGGSHGESGISLVIQGGESHQAPHRGRPFNVGWARSVRETCKWGGVAYFLKQLGSAPYIVRYNENSTTDPGDEYPIKLRDHHGGDWSEWSDDLRVREFPVGWGDLPLLAEVAHAR